MIYQNFILKTDFLKFISKKKIRNSRGKDFVENPNVVKLNNVYERDYINVHAL